MRELVDEQWPSGSISEGSRRYRLDRFVPPSRERVTSPVRILVSPERRYPSPRRLWGWLITLVRRAVLRLVFPALTDVAAQADAAVRQLEATLGQQHEFACGMTRWSRWVEEAMQAEAAARESLYIELQAVRKEGMENVGQVIAASSQRLEEALAAETAVREALSVELQALRRETDQSQQETVGRIGEIAAESSQRLEEALGAETAAREALSDELQTLRRETDQSQQEAVTQSGHVAARLAGLEDVRRAVTARLDQLSAVWTTQLQDLRRSLGQIEMGLAEVEQLRRHAEETETALKSRPRREVLDALTARVQDFQTRIAASVQALDERVSQISEDYAPRELLDAVASTAARLDRFEEQTTDDLTVLRARIDELASQPVTLHELGELSERVDQVRAEVSARLEELATELEQVTRDGTAASTVPSISRGARQTRP